MISVCSDSEYLIDILESISKYYCCGAGEKIEAVR